MLSIRNILGFLALIYSSSVASLHTMLSPELEITKQEIAISPDQIKASYLIDNTSRQDIIQTLFVTQPGNLTVDQQEIECKLITRAISPDGRDISAILKTYGLPFDPILAIHGIDASPNRDLIRKKFTGLDLLNKDDETPKWIAKSFCYWQQNFPAGQQITIKQTIKPATATKNLKVKSNGSILSMPVNALKSMYNLAVHWRTDEQLTPAQLQEQLEAANPELKEYCPTLKDFETLLSAENNRISNRKSIESKTINFDFSYDNFATSPIKNLTLKINSPSNMHPMLCWKGNLKANKNTLVFESEDYVPLSNINVLFIELP